MKPFCKHENAKILYASRKVINNRKDYIYYCQDCRKYARGTTLLNDKGKFVALTDKKSLKWSKKLGDITGYTYLGL